jgi:hypothetical protein
VVRLQLQTPSKKPSKATASSSGGSYYFIYTFQGEYAITDVDIKAKLALRGTAAPRTVLLSVSWNTKAAGSIRISRHGLLHSRANQAPVQGLRCGPVPARAPEEQLQALQAYIDDQPHM